MARNTCVRKAEGLPDLARFGSPSKPSGCTPAQPWTLVSALRADDKIHGTPECGHGGDFRHGAPMTHFPDYQFRRDVVRLHSLGPRALAEFLAELGADTFRMTDIERRLSRYAGMDPAAVRVVGGDRFPARPALRLVGGRRHG